jgi:hypothetical protein
MNGDISRQTFNPAKGYTAVVMQQGRVQLDADWNEQQAIHAHRLESALGDLVGATGALKDLAGRDGFQVFSPGAGALSVRRGVFYVDGIRSEIAADTALGAQPWPSGQSWPPPAGTYVVYLDVWQRHVSALEDPAIRESALGGPDTAARLQTLWQVKHFGVAAGSTCASALTPFNDFVRRGTVQANRPGRLAAKASAAAGTNTPCVLPPEAGYRGLENQLYRVEVHKGGPLGTARFKWSRENASVATAVVSVDPNNGLLLKVDGLGRDESLGFANNDWVEFVDDDVELSGSPRVLMQIDQVQPHASSILFKAGTQVPAIVQAKRPRLRRWDHQDPNNEGILTGTGWILLETGVQVRFEAGTFRPGDYWLIPARTATTAGGGTVEWPAPGDTPAALLEPHGTVHHYAPLAVVTVPGNGTFTVADCRRRFPALTEITASDVRYDNTPCVLPGLPAATTVQAALGALCARDEGYGIVVSPAAGWQQSLLSRLDPVKAAGAYVRFRPGDFPTAQTVVLAGTGHLTVDGGGLASRLAASGSECVLRFEGWASVTVRNLYAEGQTLGAEDNLQGVLSFMGCRQVLVEDCTLRTASGTRRASSCVWVFNHPSTPTTAVRVRGCRMEVGNIQVGVLVVDATRVTVEDNEIRGPATPAVALTPQQLSDPYYLRWLERALVNRLYASGVNPPAATDLVTIAVANVTLRFHSIPTLVSAWQTIANDAVTIGPAPDLSTHDRRYAWLRSVIAAVIATPARRSKYAGLVSYVNALSAQNIPAASQGVVVGGLVAREVRVLNNSMSRVGQGVHVGLGSRELNLTGQRAGVVTVSGNTIEGWASPASPFERFGIYVSGCESVRVERNDLQVFRPGSVPATRVEGVRLRGVLGRVALVRDNQLTSYTVGVAALPAAGPLPPQRRWAITDNVCSGAQNTVVDPGGVFTKTGNVP